ncbi:T9SS type A sorting domain-containing protein [Flavobacterium sp.]|uniref:T9SS type A sorting domain-containing protein n=1 Tax=Flavobacterium sp. TaxID=239 RepID=UPI0039E3C427
MKKVTLLATMVFAVMASAQNASKSLQTALAPSYDNCDNALLIPVRQSFLSAARTVNNVQANLGTLLPACQTDVMNDVWFKAVVPADGALTVETGPVSGSEVFDTVIAVYSGVCGNLTLLGCNDDTDSGTFSKVDLTGLVPGSTVYIGVWQYNNPEVGQGQFQVSPYNASLGTPEFAKSDLKYFPNPVKDVLAISSDTTIHTIEVFNLFGQLMVSRPVNAKETNMECSTWASGNYIVKIHTENGVQIARIAK